MTYHPKTFSTPIDAASQHVFRLSRGTMTLDVRAAEMEVSELLRMAERQNPKRAFLFVSTVLGRHIPVQADLHRQVLDRLAMRVAAEINTSEDVLVMGYAETAVGLGAGIHDALRGHMSGGRIGYLPTTRHPGSRDVWTQFSEDHSHATAHHVLKPTNPLMAEIAGQARTLVLVDDETTTGKTFVNLIQAMASARPYFDRICLVTLTDWSDGKVRKSISDSANIPEAAISIVSLISGAWKWDAVEGIDPQAIPASAKPIEAAALTDTPGAWRLGIIGPTQVKTGQVLPWLRDNGCTGPALIIGTGELVWQPFRLAECLSDMGIPASFLATTRSPVLEGETIRSKVTFSDHYGLGVPMYLHNVTPDEWGAIILMIENENPDCIDPILSRHLGDFAALTPYSRLIEFKNGVPCQ